MLKRVIEKFEDISYDISDFCSSWIWPGYYLRNVLFKHYNVIKIPNMKPWEFAEADYRIYYGIIEPFKLFMESNPEKYVCWYKDEEGNDVGPKYGKDPKIKVMFPKLKGTYIMDLAKEAYQFITVEDIQLNKDADYLLHVWAKYIYNVSLEDGVSILPSVYSFEDEVIKNLDWSILDKYVEDKSKFFDIRYLEKIYENLKIDIRKKEQYYLHLIVEIKDYLWT